MTILHVSADDISGGAARAAFRLHIGLRREGQDSAMLVMRRRSKDPAVFTYEPKLDMRRRIRRRWRRDQIRRDFQRYPEAKSGSGWVFSDARARFGSELAEDLPPSDIVNLHWVAGFIDHELFFPSVTLKAPIVWTLHDMNPFTGGCHYAGGCEKFESHCGACPQLQSTRFEDLSYENWERKNRAFASVPAERIRIVATNTWMMNLARRSSLFRRFPVVTIPYGLDIDEFTPRDRITARRLLGLPLDCRLVLFVSYIEDDPRKGLPFLCDALAELQQDNVALLSVATTGRSLAPEDKKLRVFRLRNLTSSPVLEVGQETTVLSDRFLSLAYNCADVFVIPSLQENFAQTVLEAMACGIPVVGFDVGGIPDMVRPGETGYLTPAGDVRALRASIEKLLTDDGLRRRLGANCREVAMAEYSLETQAKSYLKIYEELAGGAQ